MHVSRANSKLAGLKLAGAATGRKAAQHNAASARFCLPLLSSVRCELCSARGDWSATIAVQRLRCRQRRCCVCLGCCCCSRRRRRHRRRCRCCCRRRRRRRRHLAWSVQSAALRPPMLVDSLFKPASLSLVRLLARSFFLCGLLY